ncbi:MAG: hypothetical protein BVN30_10125 [Proteobacteria bacterium ST_bin16]|nr:MAG: hypothetical protein BVN30_10125 [Proteobacteria bacterium ST_bin16]
MSRNSVPRNTKMTLPPYLYKYESFSTQSLQNLKNQVIYFGSPLKFNDPYDCALSPNIKNITNDDLEKFEVYLQSNPEQANWLKNQYGKDFSTPLKEMLLRIGKKFIDNKIGDFLKERGVSCFSERKDSLLMWSHYGDHCKGFCLEFSTSEDDVFKKMRKVGYSSKMPEIDIVAMFCDEDYDTIINNLYCTKATDWAYEQEWRAIHSEVGTEYGYPSSVLTGVYFGPDMEYAATEIIALILAGQNEYVKLWKGSRSKESFSVEFQQITYTPYLEAKRKGMLKSKDE